MTRGLLVISLKAKDKNYNLHYLVTGKDLAKNKWCGADNVESDDDEGEFDTLDLGSGDDH